MSAAASSASAGKRATPAETVIGRPPTGGSAAIAAEDPLGDHQPGRARCDEDELVATDPPDGVDQPDRFGQRGRHLAEHVVAGLVAALTVGGLEVVDVEDREGHLAALSPCPGELELEDPTDGPLVGQPGQRIGVGHPLEPFGAFGRGRGEPGPIGGHRGERGDRAEGLALRVGQRVRRRPAEAHRPEGQVHPSARHGQRQVGADERRPIGLRRLAVERCRARRGRDAERMGRIGHLGRQPRDRAFVHPVHGDRLEAGAIGIRDEDRAHRRPERGGRSSRAGRRAPPRARRRPRSPRWRGEGWSGDRWAGRRSTRGTPARRWFVGGRIVHRDCPGGPAPRRIPLTRVGPASILRG